MRYDTPVYFQTVTPGAYDPETGDSISLTEEQEKKVLSYIERNNLHHMSLEGAYRYCEVIGPYQKAVDEIQKDEKEMEA